MADSKTLAMPVRPSASDECSRSRVLPSTIALDRLSDADLLARQREFAALRREVDAGAARIVAEVARRSTRELGYAGLAQREGARSPEQLLERLMGVTVGEARAMVRVGELLADSGSDAPDSPAAEAVGAGELSVIAADAIRSGLGEPTAEVPAERLAEAEAHLVAVAPELSVRRVAAEARALRDALDVEGVAEREEALRQRRFLRLSPQSDGMTRVAGLLDPESAALVTDAFDQITAPRRGGPRFVDPAEVERAEAVVRDPRTTEQLLLDAFVEMVRIAGAADTGRVFAQRRPAVSLHVEASALQDGAGAARLEGQPTAVSTATAHRLACAGGIVPILFHGGRVLDLGRTQRLFSERQRLALAARDGGCRFPGCDRPPSWCEAHHLDGWADDGRTDVDRGVLLCRFHHLLVHNQGWRIETRGRGPGDGFVAIPPPDRGGPPLPMPRRSAPSLTTTAVMRA